MEKEIKKVADASELWTLKGVRNFRHSPEVENFYRFVNEHGLRIEALKLMKKAHEYSKKKESKKKNVQ